jgi:hypothetical protein
MAEANETGAVLRRRLIGSMLVFAAVVAVLV